MLKEWGIELNSLFEVFFSSFCQSHSLHKRSNQNWWQNLNTWNSIIVFYLFKIEYVGCWYSSDMPFRNPKSKCYWIFQTFLLHFYIVYSSRNPSFHICVFAYLVASCSQKWAVCFNVHFGFCVFHNEINNYLLINE